MVENENGGEVELVKCLDPTTIAALGQGLWEKQVLERAQGKCSNCGSDHKVRAICIVPLDAGGVLSFENSTTLCRACEMAAEVAAKTPEESAERPVNFWVSRRLFSKIKELNGFSSTGALVRWLMGKYQQEPLRFDDLGQYQDEGCEVKVNVWVPTRTYEKFKASVNEAGMTVTEALKSLIRMYEEETDPRVARKDTKA